MGLAISGWASSASAHHAFAAEFDANKPVNFKGTITKMEWINPHTWLHVDVKQPDGTAGELGDRSGHAERAVPARLHQGHRCCPAPRS